MKSGTIFRRISLAVLVFGLLASLVVCEMLIDRERAEIVRRTAAEAQHFADQMQTGIERTVAPLARMGAWWVSQGRPLDNEDWDADTQLFWENSSVLREVFWIGPDGMQRWSAVPGSVPDSRPVRAREAVLRLVKRAQRRRTPTLSAIFDLPGGRPGVYACVPIWARHRAQGYVMGVYDVSALVESLSQSRLPDDYDITLTADGRELYSTSRGTAEAGKKNQPHREAGIPVFDRRWTASVRLSADHFARFQRLVLGLGALFTALLYLSALLLQVSHRRSSQLQAANAALESEMQERTRAEAIIRELNHDLKRRIADFQTLLEVIPIGIAIADDPECSRIWVNPALARMMGVPRSLNISMSGPEAALLPFRIRRYGQELPPEELPMQRAAAHGLEITEENEVVRADGATVNILSFATPLFDEGGSVRGVMNACVDITERKRQEEDRSRLLERERASRRDLEAALTQVRESETRFARLMESDVIGVFIADARFITYANQSFLAMIGFPKPELSGARIDWREITPQEQRADDEERLRGLLASGKLAAVEKDFLHASGRRVPVLVGGTLLESGANWKAICFVLDLTSRRELERRLRRAQKMQSLGVMAGGIAHDFNNLLTSVLGNAALALDRVPPQSDLFALLTAIVTSGNRAAELTRQVMAYTGHAYHSLKPVNLSELVAGMRPSLQTIAGSRASIRLSLDGAAGNVLADTEELQQVITSLVVNAVEAIGSAGGEIEISTRDLRMGPEELAGLLPDEDLAPGEYVCVEIGDTGCGMPVEVASRAFDPFFTTKFLGRGLGLSAAQGILRAHGGSIRLESSPDTGTRVQLYMPRHRTGGAPPGLDGLRMLARSV